MPLRAADLIRSVGLTVDGPVQWGHSARSNSPGVYAVELPAPLPNAPVDHTILRAWIERVPTLMVDGARPTPHELADRLGAFWYADQTVLYIGRTSRSLRNRVEGLYQTPLGDPRPVSGGHWIKTLRDQPKMLVWWADTDADEEAEDALLSAFEKAVDPATAERLRDPTVVVPFANMQGADSLRKDSGITGALLSEAEALPSMIMRSDRLKARPSGSAGARSAATGARTSTARPTASRPWAGAGTRSGGSAPRRTAPKAPRPSAKPAPEHLSAAGIEALRAELEDLRTVKRPDVVHRITAARELGDLSENADYESARHDQSFIEGRIRTVEDMLDRAVLIDEVQTGDAVHFGSTVVLEREGHQERFTIVGPAEANPREGRISHVSPIGQAVLGKRQGDEVVVTSPGGETRYRIADLS
jgi:transcription elongation factor GreA